jgi:hypothetical protein
MRDGETSQDGDLLAATAVRIMSHPRFDEAFAHYIDNVLNWQVNHKSYGKASTNHTRSSIVGYILYLNYRADPADPDDGASYSKIWSICEKRGDCGPRVLKTQLALMSVFGFLDCERGAHDRRLRLYRPTGRMYAYIREWYSGSFGCFDRLKPNQDYAGRVRQDPEFLRHIILSISPPYLDENILLVKFFPFLFDLFMQEAGFTTSALLIQAQLHGESLGPIRDIARRYGVSESQVRKVLRQLESQGLAGPSLLALYKSYVARELALYARYALPEDVLDS